MIKYVLSLLLIFAVAAGFAVGSPSTAEARPLLDLTRTHDKATQQADIVCHNWEVIEFEIVIVECKWARSDNCKRAGLYLQDRGTCDLHMKLFDHQNTKIIRCDKTQGYRQTASGRIKTIRRGTRPRGDGIWQCRKYSPGTDA